MAQYTPKSKNNDDEVKPFSESDLHLTRTDEDKLDDDYDYDYESFDNFSSRSSKVTQGYFDEDGNYSTKPKKKKRKGLTIFLIIIAVIVAAIIAIGAVGLSKVQNLKSTAYEMADDLNGALGYVKEMDVDGASESIENVSKDVSILRTELDDPLITLASKIPVLGSDITQVGDVLDIIDESIDQVVNPLLAKLKEEPLSKLKRKKGFNVKLIRSYMDFLEEIAPELISISDRLNTVHLSIDKNGTIEKYAAKFSEAIDQYEIINDYIPLIEEILGDGEDKLYLLVAQNSAEIRASGGFPGSVGTITIKNGYLKVGDFNPVLSMFQPQNLESADITDEETTLFGTMYKNWAHDACYNPNFDKVAHIWEEAYYNMHGEYADGVIAMTPVIIQKLLGTMGDVKLSDGTILTGENATRILQHDFYYKYLQSDVYSEESVESNDKVDELFSETAKLVLSNLMDDFSPSNITDYFQILSDGALDRTIIISLNSVTGTAATKAIGITGALNDDPNNPVAGVYFDFSDPSKLGWFLDINTEMSDPITNVDGSKSYNITVTLENMITEDEMNAGTYITGTYGGAIEGYVYFFAPAGGTISNFVTSDGMTITEGTYEGLEVGYNKSLMLESLSPVTISYTVTTQAGVETPLKIETTPTLQAYR